MIMHMVQRRITVTITDAGNPMTLATSLIFRRIGHA